VFYLFKSLRVEKCKDPSEEKTYNPKNEDIVASIPGTGSLTY
jgi:hypothetical protein